MALFSTGLALCKIWDNGPFGGPVKEYYIITQNLYASSRREDQEALL